MIVDIRKQPELVGIYETFLYGQRVEKCFYADEETGIVGCYAIDRRGRMFPNPYTGQPAERWVKGEVKISKISPVGAV